jgi:prevent-host-death family protein
MAVRMGIRELRDGFTTAIRRVRAGETIEVTHDGVPVALLIPPRTSQLDRLVAEGVVVSPRRPLDLSRPLLPRARGARGTTEIIRDDRDGA